MDLKDYKGILVYAEQREGVLEKVGLELIGKANQLAKELDTNVTALVIGSEISDLAQELVEFGADRVIVVDEPILKNFDTEAYAQVFKTVLDKELPEAVLFGATTLGRDLAPRVSARMVTGLTADCTVLEVSEDKQLWMTRPAFGGNLMATIVCPDHRPQMSSVRPGVMKRLPREVGRKGEIINFPITIDTSKVKVKVLEIVKEVSNQVDISDSKILISGGRGIGNKANLELLEELAAEVGGVVSGSRALSDAGHIGHDRQVGQTGKTVRPEIYFALGISGAIQHVAGMEESEYIVAINKDKYAPIFQIADLGIIGDVTQLVPLLTAEIKKYKASK